MFSLVNYHTTVFLALRSNVIALLPSAFRKLFLSIDIDRLNQDKHEKLLRENFTQIYSFTWVHAKIPGEAS